MSTDVALKIAIPAFRGAHRRFSNFAVSAVLWGDDITPERLWPCVEVPYQLGKSRSVEEREALLGRIREVAGAAEGEGKNRAAVVEAGSLAAKRESRHLTIRSDWDVFKLPHMVSLVFDKAGRSLGMLDAALATGDGIIVEGNYHGDTYWGQTLRDLPARGIKAGDGDNWLGRIWMEAREIGRRADADRLIHIGQIIRGNPMDWAARCRDIGTGALLDLAPEVGKPG